MRKYGFTILARNTLSPQELENNLIENLTSIVNENGGKIIAKKYWGLSRLSYIIKKMREAHYFVLIIECSAEALIEFKRKIKLNELIIRYMDLRLEEGSTPEADLQKCSFDVALLKSYTSQGGRILPRRITGLSASEQHKVKKDLKRARILALIIYCDRHR